MKYLIRVVIICAFAQAYLNFHYLKKLNGFDEVEGPKEPEGPEITTSPFQRMAMVVSEVAQSSNWNSLSDDEKIVVAKFLYEMVANPPKFSSFGG